MVKNNFQKVPCFFSPFINLFFVLFCFPYQRHLNIISSSYIFYHILVYRFLYRLDVCDSSHFAKSIDYLSKRLFEYLLKGVMGEISEVFRISVVKGKCFFNHKLETKQVFLKLQYLLCGFIYYYLPCLKLRKI